jgi:2-oxoglutarate ferredoxin oxidoreductase subunit alpha
LKGIAVPDAQEGKRMKEEFYNKVVKSVLPAGPYCFSGDEAVAEGALSARCGYFAGYPITPATEIMERVSHRFPINGAVFMQMEDEISSIGSSIGAVWAGAKAMTATSGPGLSLMQEGIGYAAITETPLVIVDVQRAGPGTGQASKVGSGDIMQVKWGSHGDYQIIALSPWSVDEMYYQTINAFNLAEKYRVPVFLLADAAVGHLQEKIEVKEEVKLCERIKKKGTAPFDTKEEDGVPPMPAFGEGEKLSVTGSTHDGFGVRKSDDPIVQAKLTARLSNKIINNKEKIIDYEDYYLNDAKVIIVSYGFTARSSLFAVNTMRKEGKTVGMVRLKTIWPFPDTIIKEIGKTAKSIFVPEMNKGQVAGEIMKYAACEVNSYGQTNGEIITPSTIIEQLRRIL